jgi:hypothetical protein
LLTGNEQANRQKNILGGSWAVLREKFAAFARFLAVHQYISRQKMAQTSHILRRFQPETCAEKARLSPPNQAKLVRRTRSLRLPMAEISPESEITDRNMRQNQSPHIVGP